MAYGFGVYVAFIGKMSDASAFGLGVRSHIYLIDIPKPLLKARIYEARNDPVDMTKHLIWAKIMTFSPLPLASVAGAC